MPSWLIQILVNLAIQFGLPWLIKVFPWAAQFEDILNKLILDIQGALSKKEIVMAKLDAKYDVAQRLIDNKYGKSKKVASRKK